jgi:hypothetical protein
MNPMASAPTIDELLLGDDPDPWASLGFDVSNGCCQLGEVCLRFVGGEPRRGIVGWSLRDLRSTMLDGLTTTHSTQPPRDPASVHPNGVVALDHIVAMSPALDRSILALQAAGLDLRRIREEPTPAGAPRQAFFRLGAEILELIQEPERVREQADDCTQAAQFWGLALRVNDIERSAERFAPHVSPVRAAVQPGRQIATLRRSAGLAIPVALITDPPAAS